MISGKESTAIVSEKPGPRVSGHEFRSLIVLSLSFTAIFTAYLAIQNLQSSLNQEAGLGIIALSCMYACIIVSGVLAPAVIRVTGEKWMLVAAFLSHVVYTGTNFYPTFATLVPASVLLGLTAGPMWTSQSVYLADRAYSYAVRTGADSHAILSRFNGIFFTMYETTQITGNLISSLVLQQGVTTGTHGNETVDNSTVKYCGRDDCPLATNATEIEEPERKVVYILLGVFLVCDLIGVLLTAFFLPPLRRVAPKDGGKAVSSLVACGRALLDPNLALLVPLIMIMAMEQAILWTDYTKSYISCPVGIQKIGFVMATYGGATAVSALTFSRLAKYTGRYVLFGLAGVINMAVFIVLYLWKPTADNITIIFIVPVVWGIAEGIWQTQSNALIALLFPDKRDAAFANYHTWKAIGFTITFVYSSFLCVSVKLIVAIVLLAVGMAMYALVEVRIHWSKQYSLTAPDS